MRHVRWSRNPGSSGVPDLIQVKALVSSKVFDALIYSSDHLGKSGIRFALCGGLAVGAYGYVRATKDVDFLVGPEGFTFHTGGIITLSEGIPVSYSGIPIDSLSGDPGEEQFVEVSLANTEVDTTFGIPIVSLPVLIYMKLKTPRLKDLVDVVELLKLNELRVPEITGFIDRYGPSWMMKKLSSAIDKAQLE
jgi:hypothetical protein